MMYRTLQKMHFDGRLLSLLYFSITLKRCINSQVCSLTIEIVNSYHMEFVISSQLEPFPEGSYPI